MSYRYKIFIFLSLCVLLFPLTNYAGNNPFYNKVVFLGDSLTDDGNLYRSSLKFIPKSPPYYQGRFSNGLVWADNIAAYLKTKNDDIKIENYAVGGETAIWHNPFDGFLPYVLSQSIDKYLLWSGAEDRSNTLYFLWIGGNDYLSGGADIDKISTNVVQAMQTAIERLIASGGRHFIILNLPDLARVPYGRDGGVATSVHALTVMSNEKLVSTIMQLQQTYTEVKIGLFDTYQMLNNMMDKTVEMNERYHTRFTNTTEGCWQGGYFLQPELLVKKMHHDLNTSQMTLDIRALAQHIVSSPDLTVAYSVGESFTQNGIPCADPDAYLFWDKVHPSFALHQVLTMSMIEFMNKEGF